LTAITENYGLTKPAKEDFYDIEVQNGNMETIDLALKELETDVAQVREELELHRSDNMAHGIEAMKSGIDLIKIRMYMGV